MPNYKDTLLVRPDDPELDSGFITYNSPKGGGEIKGLLSKPKAISEKLDISVGTVKSRIARARDNLRGLMGSDFS